MERVQICCLKGIGPATKRFRVIALEGKHEVTIGRADDNTVSIVSNMISRKHAILNKNEANQWTITDNKSLNGIFINDEKLNPNTAHTLSEGDSVQLGVKVSPDKPADYLWTFFNKLSVKKFRKSGHDGHSGSLSQDSLQDSEPLILTQNLNSSNRKRVSDENCPSPSKRSCMRQTPTKDSPTKGILKKKVNISPQKQMWSPSTDMKRQMEEQEERAKEQLLKQQEELAKMQKLLAEGETAKEKLEEELKEKERTMKEELLKQQEHLELQRMKLEEELKRNYEQQLKDKEDSLLTRLRKEKQRLLGEKEKIETSLQTEMERKLGEKDKDYQERLVKEKEKLDKIIEQKEIHQKLLETQLNDTKTENEKQKETALRAKEDILSNFTELIETELQCSICSELFVQATSLNCSHSYCSACIEQWMKVKKDCPVCRTPITSHIRSIVLDSYIDKMVEHLSVDMKESRQQLVAERKAEREKAQASTAPSTSTSRGRGRVRGGGAGGRRGGLMAGNEPPTTVNSGVSGVSTRSRNTGIVVLSSSEASEQADYAEVDLGSSFSEDEQSSEADSDDESGNEDAYFGGYGRCFRCGSRGHWANGCPY